MKIKKIYLLDHFKGLIHYNKKIQKFQKSLKDNLLVKKQIQKFINFFNFNNIKIIDKDATTLTPHYFKKFKILLAYFDMDLYEPTFVH